MPKQKQKKPSSAFHSFLDKRPIVGYIVLTLTMMCTLLLMEKGTDFYRASILQIPQFDGTTMPVKSIPDWVQTGGKNDRNYSTYSPSELIAMPIYDPNNLEKKCAANVASYKNECITYSTVYMGSYKMDHKEYGGSHLAVDIRVPIGTPVYSVANGVVDVAEQKNTGFGRYVVVKHPDAPLLNSGNDTLYSAYAHLSVVSVEVGDIVKKGDLVGYSGDTGISTTPHLHFQVDRSSAPYHPWWPFTSTQASNAGVSFFEGIDAGVGQAEAIENTVNPLLWVQKYLSNSHISTEVDDSDDQTPSDTTPKLGKILLKLDSDKIELGESATLFLTVLDENKKIFTDYTGANLQIVGSHENVEISQPRFVDGKAEAVITPLEAGAIGITVRDGDKANTEKITVTEKAVPDIAVVDETPEVDIPESVENTDAIASVKLSAEDAFLIPGQKTKITVTAFDSNGEKIDSPEFSDDLTVSLKGFGRVEPTVLKSRYFTDGVAKVNFYADDVSGHAEVYLEKFPTEKVALDVVEKAETVSQFGISSDGFEVGKTNIITIHTLDSDGNITPKSFPGTAKITVESGKATLLSSELTSEDFIDGKAEVKIIPTTDDPIILKIKSGVLVGISDRIRERKEPKEIFTDISSDHPNADAIEYLKEKNILTGNPDGSFRPSGTINRAEFAKVILLALNIDPEPATGKIFTDVPKDAWFAGYAETAAKHGLIKGYPDGSFGPANTINRAELFTMLSRATNVADTSSDESFADVPEGAWFASAADFAAKNNLLDFQGNFLPAKSMSRAEVAESVSRFLHL